MKKIMVLRQKERKEEKDANTRKKIRRVGTEEPGSILRTLHDFILTPRIPDGLNKRIKNRMTKLTRSCMEARM